MTRPQPPQPPSHSMYEYETWIEDGLLYVTVIPDAWWKVDEEGWRRIAHRKARKIIEEHDLVVKPEGRHPNGKLRMTEFQRVYDYAMPGAATQVTFTVPIESEVEAA